MVSECRGNNGVVTAKQLSNFPDLQKDLGRGLDAERRVCEHFRDFRCGKRTYRSFCIGEEKGPDNKLASVIAVPMPGIHFHAEQ